MSDKWTRTGFPILIFTIALLQYANTANFDFAWDDKLVITGNDYTRQGFSGLGDIFTKPVTIPNKNVYRPVPQSLFAIEYAFFGENPRMFHVFSLIWYGLACLGVYFFFIFLFQGVNRFFLFLATLLFIVHPLHVEVVANIKSRDEILALLFGLISVIWLTKGVERKKLGPILLGLLCLTLSLLSKENAITLLPMVPLAVWIRSGQLQLSRDVVISAFLVAGVLGVYFKMLPVALLSLLFLMLVLRRLKWQKLLVLVFLFGIISVLVFNADISGNKETPDLQLDATILNNVFLWTTESGKVIPTSVINIGRYFYLYLIPYPLVHLYGYNQIPLSGWADPYLWLVLLILGVMMYYLISHIHRRDLYVFGLLFFISTYTIYSNIFVLAPDTMADRYMFFPSVGLSLICMHILIRAGRFNPEKPDFTKTRGRLVLVVFSLVMGGFFMRTWLASRDWENDYTLIYNRIRYMENNAAAQATLGIMIQRESLEERDEGRKRKLRSRAAGAFTKAIAIYPDFYLAWTLIGKSFVEEGYYEKAELAFLKAQAISPLSPDAYQCLGALYFIVGDTDRSIGYLEKSILLDPQLKEAYVMLGKAYIQHGDIQNLGSLTLSAMKWFPDNADLEAFNAFYLLNEGQYQEAYNYARSSLAKDSNNLLAISVMASPSLQQFQPNN